MKKNNDLKEIRKKLLNKHNRDIITLTDGDHVVEFEQVVIFPYGKKILCILHPIFGLDGIEPDESLAFIFQKVNGEYVFELADEQTGIKIFDMYYDLIEGKVKPFAPKGYLKLI